LPAPYPTIAPPTVAIVPLPTAAPIAAPVAAPTVSAWVAHPPIPASDANKAITILDLNMLCLRLKRFEPATDYTNDPYYGWCQIVTVGKGKLITIKNRSKLAG
jgi:hypothetical protein